MRTYRLALLTAGATYLLVLVGGLVHSKGASLACPDWPLCYGMFFPPMRGNILYEHGHRLIAATVGMLTAFMACVVWKKERHSLRPLAILAVVAVLVQIVLGGLTVIFLLPDLISTAHLAVGSAFFSTLVILCVRTAPNAVEHLTEIDSRSRRLILAATAITFLQMVVGALVRHTGSGLACPDIPYCRGEWLPPVNSPSGLHMIHRYGALAAIASTALAYIVCRKFSALRRWSALAVALAVGQILVGIFSVRTELSIGWVMAHLAIAELILMCLVVLSAKTSSRLQVDEHPALAEVRT